MCKSLSALALDLLKYEWVSVFVCAGSPEPLGQPWWLVTCWLADLVWVHPWSVCVVTKAKVAYISWIFCVVTKAKVAYISWIKNPRKLSGTGATLGDPVLTSMSALLSFFNLSLAASGVSCGTWTLLCITWGLLLWLTDSLVVLGLSGPAGCGVLVPGSGIEPQSAAMQGGFLATGPPGKPLRCCLAQGGWAGWFPAQPMNPFLPALSCASEHLCLHFHFSFPWGCPHITFFFLLYSVEPFFLPSIFMSFLLQAHQKAVFSLLIFTE